MYCPNCGKKLEDDSIFCGYCGAKVIDTEDTPENSQNVREEKYPGEAPAGYKYIPDRNEKKAGEAFGRYSDYTGEKYGAYSGYAGKNHGAYDGYDTYSSCAAYPAPDSSYSRENPENTGEGTQIYSGSGENPHFPSDNSSPFENPGFFDEGSSFPSSENNCGESSQRSDEAGSSGGHPFLPVIISLIVGICAAGVLFLIFSGKLHLPGKGKGTESPSSVVSETTASISAAGSTSTGSSSAKAKQFNAFDGVTVKFSGYDGLGTAAVSGQAADGLTYKLSAAQALSNGDTVTLTVKSPDDSDGTFTAYTKKTGKEPEALTKDFTVSGLTSNLTKLSQIPQDEISNLDSHCQSLRNAEVANTWNTNPSSNVHETMRSMKLLGEYLLTSQTAGNNNHLYFVYQITYSSDLRSATDYYYTFRFDNITIGSDGSVKIPNASTPVTPDDNQIITMDSAGHYVVGYPSEDAFYNAVIAPQSSTYNVTGNIK